VIFRLEPFFLNGERFYLRESVDISFLNTYVNGRFVQCSSLPVKIVRESMTKMIVV